MAVFHRNWGMIIILILLNYSKFTKFCEGFALVENSMDSSGNNHRYLENQLNSQPAPKSSN